MIAQRTRPCRLDAAVHPMVCIAVACLLQAACGPAGRCQAPTARAELNIALLRAAGHNRDAEVISLLAKGADPNARAPKGSEAPGWTPLMLIATHRGAKPGTIKAMQKAGADIDAADALGRTALMHAATLGRLPSAKLLLDCGAHVDKVDTTGDSALMTAAFLGYDEVVRLLLAHGANADMRNAYGQTALLSAARMANRNGNALAKRFYPGYVRTVRALLANGAKPNLADANGHTPLMPAAYRGNTEIVVDLLKRHADVNARDNKGKTALQEAMRSKQEAVVQLLKKAGAKQ